MVNHWWQVPLYVSAARADDVGHAVRRGAAVEVEFDFIDHELALRTSDGARRALPLAPRSVADFYARVPAGLARAGRRGR